MSTLKFLEAVGKNNGYHHLSVKGKEETQSQQEETGTC